MPKPPRYYGIEKIVQLHQTRKASLVPTSANNGVIQWKQYKGNKTRDQTVSSPKLVLKRVSLLVLDKAIHNWGWNSLEFWILILMRRLWFNEEKSLVRVRYYKSPELKPSFMKQYPILLTFWSSFFLATHLNRV
jgi:hypothetical protein